MKRLMIAVVAGLLLCGAGCAVPSAARPSAERRTTTTEPGFTVFVGDGCPHCADLEAKVGQRGWDKTLPVRYAEVFKNADNAKRLMEKAKACNLPVDQIGVPFLWTGSACLSGTEPIFSFLETQAK